MQLIIETNCTMDLDQLIQAIANQARRGEIQELILGLDAEVGDYEFTQTVRDKLNDILREEDEWQALKQKKKEAKA